MSKIKECLENILKSRYGKDVRQSIHDSIEEINNIASDAKQAAVEAQDSASKSADSALESEKNALLAAETASNTLNFFGNAISKKSFSEKPYTWLTISGAIRAPRTILWIYCVPSMKLAITSVYVQAV